MVRLDGWLPRSNDAAGWCLQGVATKADAQPGVSAGA